MQKLKLIITTFNLLFVVIYSFSQGSEVGIGVGVTNYWGDLNVNDNFENIKNGRLAIRFHGRSFINKRINHRVSLVIGTLTGNDNKATDELRKMRNLNFRSILIEMSYNFEYNLLPYDYRIDRSSFAPFIALGVGAFYFNPTTEYNGNTVSLQPLGTEGQGVPGIPRNRYKRVQLTIPVGGGLKMNLGNGFAVEGSIMLSYGFTDYIDDVSTEYIDYNLLFQYNGELSANLSDRRDEFLGLPEGSTDGSRVRGGPDVNDFYFTSTISFSYLFSKNIFSLKSQIYCPTVF